MKYTQATADHLSEIEAINEIIDYGNPESFMKEEIAAGRVIVAVDGAEDEVIGYGLYQVIWGNNPFLALVKVKPPHQRQKIGTNLVSEIEKKLKKEGFKKLLSSCELDNRVSVDFQKSLGFEPGGSIEMVHGWERFFIKDIK